MTPLRADMTSLAGRRIVVTREEPASGPLSSALREAGAIPLSAPAVEVVPLHSPEDRARLLPSPAGFDWLVITSPRTVRLLSEAEFFVAPPPESLRIAVAGEQTAAALRDAGWPPDRIPETAGAEPLLGTLLQARDESPGAGRRVLFPASEQAGDLLPRGLEAQGYEVRRIDLYAPRPRPQDRSWWADRSREGLDAVTFTSPSAVDGLTRGIGEGDLLDLLRRVPAGVQGPTTAAAAREAGWAEVVEARPRSFQGLVDALEAEFSVPSDAPTTPHRLRA